MEDDQAAVHVFQEVELALEDVVDPVGEVLVGVGIRVLALDHGGTGVDQPTSKWVQVYSISNSSIQIVRTQAFC